jgi:hypothetical protein
MKVNSHSLRIGQGKVEIDKELSIGTYGVKVLVMGDIVKEERHDNEDGTIDVVYVLKASAIELVK